jgi:CBS domain containing-hemolysin-like protein
MARDVEALAVHVRDLEEEGFVEPEAQARDGGEVGLMVEGGSRLKELSELLDTEDGRETVGGLRAQQRQRGPVTLQDGQREKADAMVADAHGRGGGAIDVFAGQARAL